MTLLDKLLRVPTKWDCHEIHWDEWGVAPIVCGKLDTSCEMCGCQSPGIMRHGRVEHSHHQDGVVVLRTSQKKHLTLWRCTGCATTTVWDGAEYWQLGEEDYGPKGSHEKEKK